MLRVATPTVDISRALTIGGWMSEDELLWLATQALSHQYIVEFGSFHGRSARAMADNMIPEGKLWAVDPWMGDYKFENGDVIPITTHVMPYFIHNLKEYVNDGRVIPVRDFSYRFSLDHKVDMVFIDGDHRYETVKRDIEKALELLKPGGLICGHDFGHPQWHGVDKAVTEYFGKVEVCNTIWHTLKS